MKGGIHSAIYLLIYLINMCWALQDGQARIWVLWYSGEQNRQVLAIKEFMVGGGDLKQ